MRQRAQARVHDPQALQQQMTALAEKQGMRHVVDVFRCATEVNEFTGALQDRHLRGVLLDPVFDGLDVVIDARLDVFDLGTIGQVKIARQGTQRPDRPGVEGRQFG